jgi:hypothetical protein
LSDRLQPERRDGGAEVMSIFLCPLLYPHAPARVLHGGKRYMALLEGRLAAAPAGGQPHASPLLTTVPQSSVLPKIAILNSSVGRCAVWHECLYSTTMEIIQNRCFLSQGSGHFHVHAQHDMRGVLPAPLTGTTKWTPDSAMRNLG